METDLSQNVAAIMATRNVDAMEATRIALLNVATSAECERRSYDVDSTIEFLMLQLDLLPNQRAMPARIPKGMRGHRYPAKKKVNVEIVADDARQVVTVGSTQADFD